MERLATNSASRTLIPNFDSSFLWAKRQRDESPFSSHVVPSQSDDHAMDIVRSPAAKRVRLCHDDLTLSPCVVSVTPEHDAAAIMDTSKTSPKKAPVPWWKNVKKKSLIRMRDDKDLICFVCESVFTPREQEESRDVMPSNSLLAYFPVKATSKKTSVPKPQCTTWQNDASCTFCEREACHQCLRQCEECNNSFCTFCTKNDYYGSYTRTVCVDCHQEECTNDEMEL